MTQEQVGQVLGVAQQTVHDWLRDKSDNGEPIAKEGIYGYVCEPHIGFGMVGVIVVGNVTQEMKDAAMKQAMETLEGPFRRLIGKLKKVKVQ